MNEPFIFHKPVDGSDFIGRSAETRGLANILSSGGNAVIYEPPRSGKHSLLGQAVRMMNSSGQTCVTARVDMLSARTPKDLATAFGSAVVNACCSSATECSDAAALLLRDTHLVFDPAQYSAHGLPVTVTWDPDRHDFETLFRLPCRIAEIRRRRLVVLLDEFHSIIHIDGGETLLDLLENAVREQARSGAAASYVFCGSRINAMHRIFGTARRFFRLADRIRLSEIPESDIVAHVNKGFNASGKVMDRDLVMGACRLFRNNMFYLNQLCAICSSLTRGYVVENTMKDALDRMLAINEPYFRAMVEGLTTFQTNLLRAVLEGHTKFTVADVIEDYGLNSSANVKRLKDALCQKEIISFDDGGTPYVIDPLFEYWAKTFYFRLNG